MLDLPVFQVCRVQEARSVYQVLRDLKEWLGILECRDFLDCPVCVDRLASVVTMVWKAPSVFQDREDPKV